jgi:CBS domain-containing protein
MYKAKDIMSRDVATIKKDAAVKDVIRLLVEHKITGLPVVDEDMYLLGMVTEKDVLKTLYEAGGRSTSVSHLMTTDVISFNEDEPLISVYKCLVENNFRRLPILSEGRLVGIISRGDIVRFLFERAAGSRTMIKDD